MKDEEILFAEPVLVQLAKYPVPHRVLGVKRCRNPNGYGRKLYVYAIAEWRHPGGTWKPIRDLATLMRLANQVEHPFPRNSEPYANRW